MLQAGTRWHAAPYSYEEAYALASDLGLSAATASVLVRRGYRDPESARRFIEGGERHDPFQFKGMEEAVALIARHVSERSTIVVHGDYDVDGVCSTALLVEALRALGADVRPRLPSRMDEGYGLSSQTVEEIHGRGARLLVTADCGIGAVEQVDLARRLGMDVIVTDHHLPGETLPDCPLVHPAECGYPCPDLCATGVVFKLVEALGARIGTDPARLETHLDLVALATVADVVPLVGENRALVKAGLRAIASTARPGLRALMRVAGVDPQTVGEHSVAFALAPRINAAGRLYRADAALELMLTDDERRAHEIARELDAVNSERQSVETRILLEAEAQVSTEEARRQPVFVLAGESWHRGVVGIVASRLVERYHRPCVLLSLDEDGRARGSGRSISAYDLHAGLAACAEHLERFGGHRMAAGVELYSDRLDAFRQALVAHADAALDESDLVRTDRIDAIVSGDAVGLDLAEELEQLRPFGMGNPAVNLLLPAARVADVRPMGEGRHARLLIQSGGVRSRAVAFGSGGNAGIGREDLEARHDLVGRLEANEWQGAVEPRLVVRSLHQVEDAQHGRSGCEGCSDCDCRARGDEWWAAVWREFERELPADGSVAGDTPVIGPRRQVVDGRGQGILGQLGDLLSTREPVAVVCADCSRRRALFERELAGPRFGRDPVLFASARCSAASLAEHTNQFGGGAPLVCDYATVERDPGLLAPFAHVFALDPPPLPETAVALRDGKGFLHLGWGPSEVELARRSLDHEFGLRGPLAALYRALAAAPAGIEGEALEALLVGEGRHPRAPHVIGRCLRVLDELGLAGLERSSATVSCTIKKSKGRVELERSKAFRAYAGLHRESIRFLDEQAPQRRTAKAA